MRWDGKKSPLSLLFRPSFLPQLQLTSSRDWQKSRQLWGRNLCAWSGSDPDIRPLAWHIWAKIWPLPFIPFPHTRLGYKIGPRLREFRLGSRNLGPTIKLSCVIELAFSRVLPRHPQWQCSQQSPLSLRSSYPLQASTIAHCSSTAKADNQRERCQTSANAASFLTD